MKCAKHQDMAGREFRRRMRLSGVAAQQRLRTALKTLEESEEALLIALERCGANAAVLGKMRAAMLLLACGRLEDLAEKAA